MIRQACYVCGIELGAPLEQDLPEEHISHGVCRKCLDICMAGSGKAMEDFLDSLQAPVLVVDSDVRVLAANVHAQEVVSKRKLEINGRLAGEVFECAHAHQPGGCGHTLHCQSCTIRLTVTKTFHTGASFIRVPACQDLDTFEGPRKIRYLISTERAGGTVLLRIDDAQPDVSDVA